MRADTERRDERNVARGEGADGRVVEVIVVVVGNENRVEPRERRDGDGRSMEAARAHER